MKHQLEKLIKRNNSGRETFQPSFYRLSDPAGSTALKKLITEIPDINVFDEILGQVEEYVKSTNPKVVFSKSDLTEAAKKHIGSIPYEEYGVWVYYPWSKRLVHILDEKEFIEVRTNRNMYKITPEEKAILATKRIGVIGLSVGQSIALTIAMERTCGELRIADFDILELSNLNRIRTGVHNLGTKKTIAVAREIAEIDPYLKITCFHAGATEGNIDDFITKNGKLDILVDECDGLYIKILCRQKAKKHKVPVVMDTSDRGMIDIERYDLEPDRPILHGLIDHLDINKVQEAKTNEEKVPFLLPMVGIETISSRLKASMMEVEQTITTWPQLASAVTIGGGLATDVCRRIMLDQFHDSGRYFVDTEELIFDKNKLIVTEKALQIVPSLSDTELKNLIIKFSTTNLANQISLSIDTVKQLVNAAIMAPSGANSQSWKWMYKGGSLYLFLDCIYKAGLLDCGNTTSIVGLGAATENLVIKAHALGIEVLTICPKLDKESILIAEFKFFDKIIPEISNRLEPHICDELADMIPYRLTNRTIGKREKIELKVFEDLRLLAKTIPGADLKIITNEKDLYELGEIVAKMDKVRVMHEGGHQDFRAEIRWNKEEVELFKNGIDLMGTVDLSASELIGLQVAKNWPVMKHLNDWELGTGLERIGRKCVAASSALGLLTMPEFSFQDFFIGGRAMERIWLAANKQGISVHPVSISTLIFNALIYGEKDTFNGKMKDEVLACRKRFTDIFSINEAMGEVLLIRFFKAGAPKARSIRYPLDQVLRYG